MFQIKGLLCKQRSFLSHCDRKQGNSHTACCLPVIPSAPTHLHTLSVKWQQSRSDGHRLARRNEVTVCEAADARQKPISPLALPYILLHSHVNSSLANDNATIFTASISLLQYALNSRNFNGGTTVSWVLETVTPARGQMFLHSITHWRSVCVVVSLAHELTCWTVSCPSSSAQWRPAWICSADGQSHAGEGRRSTDLFFLKPVG